MISPSLSPATTAVSLSVEEQLRQHGFEYSNGNEHELRWPEDDSAHPRNWPFWTKVFNTAVIISLDFFTTMISTVGAAAAKNGRVENNISPVFAIFAYTSIYLYGQAIGSIFFSPISESFGRKPLYIVAMFLDSGLEIVIGTVPHISAIVIGRFFSGLLSAVPTNVVAGSMEDMYISNHVEIIRSRWGVNLLENDECHTESGGSTKPAILPLDHVHRLPSSEITLTGGTLASLKECRHGDLRGAVSQVVCAALDDDLNLLCVYVLSNTQRFEE